MIDINPALMATVFVVFISLLVLLNRMLFNPMVQLIDKRKGDIKKSLNGVLANSSEVEMLKKEASLIVEEARKEASKIREDAINRAKMEFAKAVANKREEMETLYMRSQEDISVQKQNLRDSLLSQMPIFRENLKAKLSRL